MIKEPDIIPIKEALSYQISIPIYQRPYRWQEQTVLTLLNDIMEACDRNISEYRIGTLILHDQGANSFGIVDGQQRMTTLTLLLLILGYEEGNLSLLEAHYPEASIRAVKRNVMLLERKVREIEHRRGSGYIEKLKVYVLERCHVVRIMTDSEQEAFQFFDSQNSRGKALAPHDLLKSYHLREMNDESEDVKRRIIDHWENLDQDQISRLFEDYLYPLISWQKRKNGYGYDSSKIHVFKGIKQKKQYSYATYHKASHLFIEEFNGKNYNILLGQQELTPFLLTSPIIAGKRFFEFVAYYFDLIRDLEKMLVHELEDYLLPHRLTGDAYTRQLFVCSVVMFVDRFGKDYRDDMRFINILYTWAYSLRLSLHSVRKESINNYAIGNSNTNYLNHIAMFELISEMMEPQDIEEIVLEKISRNRTPNGNGVKEQYRAISNYLNKVNSEGFVEW